MYFDSSVVIDYWISKEPELSPPDEWDIRMKEIQKEWYSDSIRDLFSKELERLEQVAELKKQLILGSVRVIPIVSPLAVLELIGWYAETALRNVATKEIGTNIIQRKSRKEIGQKLKKLLIREREESKSLNYESLKRGSHTPTESLIQDLWQDADAAYIHLPGLVQVDMRGFNLNLQETWIKASTYAFLQLGLGDILHLLLAQHLGCEYFATFDSDFNRVKDIIEERSGIKVIYNDVGEMIDILMREKWKDESPKKVP